MGKTMKGGKQKSPIWAAHVSEPQLQSAKPKKTSKGGWRLYPVVELARMAKTKKLRSKLHKLCAKSGSKVPLLCFERWQCRSKLEEGAERRNRKHEVEEEEEREFLLPNNAEFVDEGMVGDLVRAKMKEDAARGVAVAMAQASSTMAEELASLRDQIKRGEHEAPAGTKVHAVFKGGIVDLSLGTEACKPYLRISREHFKKLSILFQRNSSSSNAEQKQQEQLLHEAIFCLLARYEALAGHGYQAALCGDGFDVLLEKFRCQAECFASPLNCRYSRFCSAFPDVDGPFGSWGSFFADSFQPPTGAFEANPPFVPEIMLAMANKMETLLTKAQGPLTFVVIVPAWKQIPAWRALESSKHLQAPPEIISASAHGFCDGAQHQRRPQERFRPSSFDTGVFVLAAHFPSSEISIPAVMAELREAMASASGNSESIQDYEQRVRQPNRPGGGGGDSTKAEWKKGDANPSWKRKRGEGQEGSGGTERGKHFEESSSRKDATGHHGSEKAKDMKKKKKDRESPVGEPSKKMRLAGANSSSPKSATDSAKERSEAQQKKKPHKMRNKT